jgi:thiamine biosynthesis protein ThiI
VAASERVLPQGGTRYAVVVHYHEIGLKGRNRGFFERRLVSNLTEAISGCPHERVEVHTGRLLVRTPGPPGPALLQAIGRTFGVAVFAPAVDVVADLEHLERTAVDLLTERTFGSFAIAARRATKELPFTSRDVNIRLGTAVQAATGAAVHLDAPDVTVHVEVVRGRAFVYTERLPGPGGLPVGVSGCVVALLSGGIDSPVATWRMLKRGAEAVLVHFHSAPFTDLSSARKAREIAGLLAGWHGPTTLYTVPFGTTQQQIVLSAPPALRIVLYRRFMVRVAERIAALRGAKALVTGDSLGQVASQTLDNIVAVEDAATMPTLRPLIGADKQEIVDEARRIGTFETSILPYADCCSLFVPRSPATHATVEDCRRAEEGLDVESLVEACLAEAEIQTVPRPLCGEG